MHWNTIDLLIVNRAIRFGKINPEEEERRKRRQEKFGLVH